jgi:hypothetical protein
MSLRRDFAAHRPWATNPKSWLKVADLKLEETNMRNSHASVLAIGSAFSVFAGSVAFGQGGLHHASGLLLESLPSLVQMPPLLPPNLGSSQLQIPSAQGTCTVIVRSGRASCRETGLVFSGIVRYCDSLAELRSTCEAAVATERQKRAEAAPRKNDRPTK